MEEANVESAKNYVVEFLIHGDVSVAERVADPDLGRRGRTVCGHRSGQRPIAAVAARERAHAARVAAEIRFGETETADRFAARHAR